jgi:peptide/nickel transport system substrate-binding protein
MEGAATATAQWLPEGAFGYNPRVRPRAYDPEGARRLLAEAGYPQGFRVTLSGPNDRWPNDGRLTQAIAQMWTRIGVRTEVQAFPWTGFVPRRMRFEYAVQLAAWGSSTGEASNFLANVVATRDRARLTGANNNGRYSSAAFDEIVLRGSAIMDDERREAAWHEAVDRYVEEEPYIQLIQYVNNWAVRRGMTHDPRMDERTIAMGVRRAQ